LLTDRFQLKLREEDRIQSVYFLTIDMKGLKSGGLKEVPAEQGLRPNADRKVVMTGVGARMDALARTLANQLGRPVIDKTGLTGNYDFTLTWVYDAPANANELDDGVSVFTALKDQLGLTLESARAPAQVVVIERAERPPED
jgi:uncharacterized protein (TIGR03435 family)